MAAPDLLDGWGAPHAAAGVVAEGPTVLTTWGEADRPGRWASVTKLVTALATLVAIEEGTLDVDDLAGPEGSTVRHLLAHTSGLAFDEARALAEPGRMRIYSNRGYEVLAETLADRAGIPFDRYVNEAVLQPLDMDRTRLEGSAAAGLVGPLDDLLRFAAELLHPTLVSVDTLRSATTVAFPGLAGVLPGIGRFDPLDWGLGFELRDAKSPHWTGSLNSPATFGHFGASGSFLWVDPRAGVACAALSGRDFGPWALEAWPAFADHVLRGDRGV
ncbi:MAG: beta-lactamase family protein [Actinomycetota bacterium]|nr:beta-lactamase family protein [Actinomycetota bacterium]